MRIAIDIGFGFTKVMTDNGLKKSFPSMVKSRQKNSSLRGIVGGDGDDYIVTYTDNLEAKEQNFYIGDSAMTNGGSRDWESKGAFNIKNMKILASTAIGIVIDSDEDVELAVGLPMSYYLNYKDELKKMLLGINANINIKGKGDKKIKCKSVFVFPQGAGAYYAAIYSINGEIKDLQLAMTSVGIIEIGFKTVDYLVMGKGRKGISLIDNLSDSLEDDGMHKVYQDIEKEVAELPEVNRNLGTVEIEKAILWFSSKLDFRSQIIDLNELEKKAYFDRAVVISSKIKAVWGAEGETISKILIAGGGASKLFPTMKGKFEQAELQKDSPYANCVGFLGAQARILNKENK